MNVTPAITGFAWLFATTASLYAQTNVIAPSTFSGGRLTFSRVPNTIEYQVQWSPGEQGPWTTLVHAAESAGLIHGPGAGSITAAVPLNFRVIARSTDPNSPEGMVTIPGGNFMRGADTNLFPEALSIETPVHAIFISTFFMDRRKVTGALWSEVIIWGTSGKGYGFGSATTKGVQHPIHSLTWYDALKFCNARSERDGLTPCYISSGGVYRAGIDTNVTCNFSATGYRLPTTAEWEKAAKGGTAQLRFPWTDFTNRISHAKANYRGEPGSYDLSSGFHPSFTNGAQPWTSPVGSFPPNTYGLYDMAGNVREWCWDWHELEPYSATPAVDPTGPVAPSPSTIPIGGPIIKAVRGGSWSSFPEFQRLTYRGGAFPSVGDIYTGFRCVRRP